MNEEIKKEVKTLTPFRKFCMTIGELPTSYIETMTYYEMLMWFTKYLSETVIPAVNNNAEAVTELQGLFVELQNYVNDYFDNLDIQTEVNNKLDEMAESGQLADIIAQYLGLAGVLAFNTLNDLKNATNIVDGSICKTLGNTTYNDGYGAFYKIRTITSSDVVDGVNIVALNISNTLIAELIKNSNNGTIQNEINIINNNVENIITDNLTISNLVVISDSYGVGNSAPTDPITSFAEYMKTYLGLDNDHYYNNSYGGCGFAYPSNNKRFIDLVNECNNNLTVERKNAVSHVLFAGGYNDQYASETDIKNYIDTTISRAHEVFPNAKIYVAFIGWNNSGTNFNDVYRYWNDGVNQTKYGKFIINSQNILTGDLISGDNIHPNEDGYKKLASNLINGLQTGSCYPVSNFKWFKDTNDNTLGVIQCNNNVLTIEMYDLEFNHNGTANGNEVIYCNLPADSMISGKECRFTVPCMFVNNQSFNYVSGYCVWYIKQNVVKLLPIALKPDGTNYFDYTSIKFIHSTYNIDHKYI